MTSSISNHKHTKEAAMLPIIKEWLIRMNIVRKDTLCVEEFPWLGRRVDFVTMTKSGIICAYELKLTHTAGVIQQAAANRLSFDRSYIVSGSQLSYINSQQVKKASIGLFTIKGNNVKRIFGSPLLNTDPVVRNRLLSQVKKLGSIISV